MTMTKEGLGVTTIPGKSVLPDQSTSPLIESPLPIPHHFSQKVSLNAYPNTYLISPLYNPQTRLLYMKWAHGCRDRASGLWEDRPSQEYTDQFAQQFEALTGFHPSVTLEAYTTLIRYQEA